MKSWQHRRNSGVVLPVMWRGVLGLQGEKSPGILQSAHTSTWEVNLNAFAQEGGQLYTWGGAFEDSATKSVPLTPRLPAQKDNHQGCLGHGDKAGRLTPTR